MPGLCRGPGHLSGWSCVEGLLTVLDLPQAHRHPTQMLAQSEESEREGLGGSLQVVSKI